MGYYTALQQAWTSVTQPPAGVVGVGLNATMTTQQKILAVNNWTVTGTVPTSFFVNGAQILNAINFAEFNALSSTAQLNILTLCNNQGQLLGGSGNTTHLAPGLIIANFTAGSQTIAGLTALANAQVQFWWTVGVAQGGAGLAAPVSLNDLSVAGLS